MNYVDTFSLSHSVYLECDLEEIITSLLFKVQLQDRIDLFVSCKLYRLLVIRKIHSFSYSLARSFYLNIISCKSCLIVALFRFVHSR